jgi:hypothetical protein
VRHVNSRPGGVEYDAWHERAIIGRNKLVEAWKAECGAADLENRPIVFKASINEKLYKEFRDVFLFEAFHRKCAYCEVNHSDGYPLQVEHYRPKGEVTEDRKLIEHLGYFWLAYEWWNLVLSCNNCNTNHTDPLGESHPGKKNEFPVQGARVKCPSPEPDEWQNELDGEDATLLNPYFDQPEQHIDFVPATGAALPVSPRGVTTIETCDLSRPSLRDKRLSLRGHAVYGMVMDLMHEKNKDKDLDSLVEASVELSLWRKRLVQECIKNLCSRVGLQVESPH